MGVEQCPQNGTSCPFGILPASCWTLLGVRLHLPTTVEASLPRCRRIGTPTHSAGQWEGVALAFFRSVWQLGTMNHMHQENPALYFATLADFIKSAQRELGKAEQAGNGTDLQTLHLSEARLKFAAAVRVIDRVLPNS